jgi:dihydroflavonol-4-reductase
LNLVTGGTGFLGEHVVRALVEAGETAPSGGAGKTRRGQTTIVRVLARSRSAIFDDLGGAVEQVAGDVLELDPAALEGVDRIYHLAGFVSRDPDDATLMMRVHVDGTRAICRAAAAAGIKRVVVASSSGTIAVSEAERIHDEESGYATDVVAGWPYYVSKIYQEKVALELGAELGLEVVVVSPSLLLGPGDRRLSSTKDVHRFLRGQIPVVPSGGVNFVDVRDAAAATVAAMERGKAGERYLLGGPNWTCKRFFGRLERVAKVRGPRLELPRRLSEVGASLMSWAYEAAGRQPPIDRMSVEMGEHFWYIDSSKAERELGFEARDPQLTLHDTVKYLRNDIGV